MRQKLTERWPGIYIPSIPAKDRGKYHKFYYNSQKEEEHFNELRFNLLNKFCKKISMNKILLNSEEVKIFLSYEQENVFSVKLNFNIKYYFLFTI